ncbi:NUDIX hydrolase [Nonomuraea angiospora]|uniref:NUDIX hydrolase n=1 Tax=Nonomuraea angiospora TaxID=46172 RepID=UPI003F546F54
MGLPSIQQTVSPTDRRIATRYARGIDEPAPTDTGRALLTQCRDNGHWEAPGGILELDEDIISGLLREIREECRPHQAASPCQGRAVAPQGSSWGT